MTTFIAIQNTYHAIEIALFINNTLIEAISIDKSRASQEIIIALSRLLNSHNLTLSNLNFIAANQGPGPFTTLRVVIATVNGLCFATGIPLIGVDGLTTLLHEYESAEYSTTVALLNAFNKDLYFGIAHKGTITTGCKNGAQLIAQLKDTYAFQQIQWIGNGVTLFYSQIQELFGNNVHIPDPLPETCSIKAVGLEGLKKWQLNLKGSPQLMPLYLKQASF